MVDMRIRRFGMGAGKTKQLLGELLSSLYSETNQGAEEILVLMGLLRGDASELDKGHELIATFEHMFAQRFGASHAVAVGSATQGLELVLETIDVSGKEVITTPFTWYGTVNPIVHARGKPVFVDVDINTFALDLDKIEAAITPDTKAILPVYPFGFVPDIDKIHALAREHDLWVVEDAAVALGSKYKGNFVGGYHPHEKCATVFSFCPTKTLTTMGGGMVTVPTKSLWQEIRARAYQGDLGYAGLPGRGVDLPGHKYNMPALHAAIGLMQLGKLDANFRRRKTLFDRYVQSFKPFEERGSLTLQHLEADHDYDHLPCSFSLVLDDRERFVDGMSGKFPVNNWPAVHRASFYARTFGFQEGQFPNAEYLADHFAVVPFSNDLTGQQERFVRKTICEYFRS